MWCRAYTTVWKLIPLWCSRSNHFVVMTISSPKQFLHISNTSSARPSERLRPRTASRARWLKGTVKIVALKHAHHSSLKFFRYHSTRWDQQHEQGGKLSSHRARYTFALPPNKLWSKFALLSTSHTTIEYLYKYSVVYINNLLYCLFIL